MTKFGINYSPLSVSISAGTLSADGRRFLQKDEVTLHAIEAVGKYVIDNHDGSGVLSLESGNLIIEARIEPHEEAGDAS